MLSKRPALELDGDRAEKTSPKRSAPKAFYSKLYKAGDTEIPPTTSQLFSLERTHARDVCTHTYLLQCKHQKGTLAAAKGIAIKR